MGLIKTSKDDLVLKVNGIDYPVMEMSRTSGADAPEGVSNAGKVVGLALGSEKLVEGTIKLDYDVFKDLEAVAEALGVTLSKLYPGTLTWALKEKYNNGGAIAQRLTVSRTKTISNVVLYENSITVGEGEKRVSVDIRFSGTDEA